MNVYVLFTGEYEGRGIHGLYTNRTDAEEVHDRVTKDWVMTDRRPDIEEHELDLPMCQICGYAEEVHLRAPDVFKHAFATKSAEEQK